jgi:carbon monoxide dehydrogenase subunit G
VEISQRITVSAPLADVWAFVSDLPSILPCMPGAACGALRDDGRYDATITVSAGEFSVSFGGIASVETPTPGLAIFRANGSDRMKTISAEAEARITLGAIDETTTAIDVASTFDFSGFLAPAARAGGGPAAKGLMKKFTACLGSRFRT